MKTGAVVVTDIVGYSKLTGDNQELALELLTEHDSIILKSIDDYNGKSLVNRGDGFVIFFSDSAKAILCSIDIQTKIKKRNKLSVKNRKFKIRIGIHSGTYQIQNGEYHGECVDVASELEPLAPKGGILISSTLNTEVEYVRNIFTREYNTFKINKSNQKTYEVFNNIIDWYPKSKKIYVSDEKKYLEKMHYFYDKGDYSASIKFANSIFESTKNKKLKDEIFGFLCNSFISTGRTDYANQIIKEIKKNYPKKINNELKAHYLKLEAHILSNNGKFKKANSVYAETLGILDSIQSKYYNEVLFYSLINLFLNSSLSLDIFNSRIQKLKNDKYKILIDIIGLILKRDEVTDSLIKKINKISKNQNKSYAFWLLSQYYTSCNMINESYEYETKAQNNLEWCLDNISDIELRNNFKKNILVHKKIFTESSVKIDDLFDFKDYENIDISNNQNLNSINFQFCINCGKENTTNSAFCLACNTDLKKESYQ